MFILSSYVAAIIFTVMPRPNTTLVDVRVQNEVAEDAALWANTLSEVYRRDATERKIQSAEDAFKWVNERLKETQSEMEEAQDNLLRSYQGQDLFVPEGSVSAISDVSFELKKGSSLGLVGESGCGKTSVALTLLRLQAGVGQHHAVVAHLVGHQEPVAVVHPPGIAGLEERLKGLA